MYVNLKFGENWTRNMGDMTKSIFLQFFFFFFFLSLFLFFSLNPMVPVLKLPSLATRLSIVVRGFRVTFFARFARFIMIH